MKKILFTLLLAAATLVTTAQKAKVTTTANPTKPAVDAKGTWAVDPIHSGLKFNVEHLVISEVTGDFKIFDGSAVSKTADFQGAAINFDADVASVSTDNEMRDKHLKSDDFFNAETYPKMSFKSISFKKVSGNKYVLVGDLTIRDITRKVTLDVKYGGIATDPYKNVKAGFKLSGKISRKMFGLKWSAATEAGGAVVGDEVQILGNIELVKKS